MSPEIALLAAVALPFIAVIPIALVGNYPNIREGISIGTGVLTFLLVAQVYLGLENGEIVDITLLEMFPGLSIRFTVEPLGMIFAGIASFLWGITTVYAMGYMRGHHEENQTRFFLCFAIAIGSALGIAFAGNMLTLFLFYEILTVSTFPLVAHHGTQESKRAGRTYLGILIGTSIALQLFAIIWTYVATGTLDFTEGGILAGSSIQGPLVGILLALYAYGIGKAALMPIHRWLPAAMVAPTPVSALLHAVAVVKAGVFTVVKVVVYIFGIDFLSGEASSDWLAYVAGFTILAASMVAIRQDNLKRRLAYSTVSQLSYVVLAAAILTPISAVGAAMHITAHAFGKITLFFAAGSIMVASHRKKVSELGGIGRRMPITMIAFSIGALSMIGLPPTVGFISKWYILQGAVQAEHIVAAIVIIGSTLLNAGYFLPIIYAAFFKDQKPSDHPEYDNHGEAPLSMVLAISLTASATLLLFFWPDISLDLAKAMVGGLP